MKKLIAVLISLLFVGSTFGVGTIMAPIDCCDPDNFDFSRTFVHVGDTFTISFNSLCIPQIIDEDQEDFVEWINFKIYDGDGNILANFDPKDPDWPCLPANPNIWYDWTYKAVKPGEVVFGMGCFSPCRCSKTITITSRALPMLKFMKILGLGKEK